MINLKTVSWNKLLFLAEVKPQLSVVDREHSQGRIKTRAVARPSAARWNGGVPGSAAAQVCCLEIDRGKSLEQFPISAVKDDRTRSAPNQRRPIILQFRGSAVWRGPTRLKPRVCLQSRLPSCGLGGRVCLSPFSASVFYGKLLVF